MKSTSGKQVISTDMKAVFEDTNKLTVLKMKYKARESDRICSRKIPALPGMSHCPKASM